MEQVTTIGLDLAKNVFQVHGVDAAGKVQVRRQLRRGDVLRFFGGLSPCLVGMEACATAHHWARETDSAGAHGAADAAGLRQALCEARQDRCRRCRGDRGGGNAADDALCCVKTVDQQAVLMLHKVRDLLVRQRTMLINALRGHLAEFGIDRRSRAWRRDRRDHALHEEQDSLPELARLALHGADRSAARLVRCEITKLEKQYRGVASRRTMPVDAWRRSRVSVRSRPAQSRPRCRMPRCSDPAANSPPGSA